jgi:hypothetical protein
VKGFLAYVVRGMDDSGCWLWGGGRSAEAMGGGGMVGKCWVNLAIGGGAPSNERGWNG